MRKRRIGWRNGLVGVGLVVALAAATLAAVPSLREPFSHKAEPLAELPRTTVRRTNLSVTMTAGGQVDSSNPTVIECELEALDVSVQGRTISTMGASTILSIIPDGSLVKQGDVLCVLNSSDYEELERTQQMNVDRARADHRQAELILEVARMAIREYKEGSMLQMLKNLEGQVALTSSDLERSLGRLAWSHRMIEKGYIPKSQLSNDVFATDRLKFDLTQGKTQLDLFNRFSAPMYLKILDSDVKAAEAILDYQDSRLQRHEERLAYLKKQIERCTIRAPHDGFVIHANEDRMGTRIEPGLVVRQRQRLFFLPDLGRMEVATMVHESVAREVKTGMRSRVRIEALDGRVLEGHVTAIAQIPSQRDFFSDVKYFTATVKLDTIPHGLKPGMTAEVEIQTLLRPDVLTIPPEALAVERGHDVCYVAHDDHVERREVKLGQTTRDRLEVTEGLDEGEQVVLDPSQVISPSQIADPAEDFAPTTGGGLTD